MKPQARTNKQRGSKLRLLLLLTACLLAFATAAQAATYTVTTNADNGNDTNPTPGSLRKAIKDANANAGTDTIAFNIPGAGVHTISPPSQLPSIADPVVIDGYTQPGASPNTLSNGDNAVLLIELDGTNAGQGVFGLAITGGGCTIKGLVINHFDGAGILLNAKGGNSVTGNFFGTNASGTAKAGNSIGVYINASSGNTVGGTTPAARNLISGNIQYGVEIAYAGSTDNLIQGNFIGTDSSGTATVGNSVALGSGNAGIFIYNVGTTPSGNVIGGTAAGAGNVIADSGSGIDLVGDVSGVTIQGNLIGTDVTGKVARPNIIGIFIQAASDKSATIGGILPSARNIISGNKALGIAIKASSPGVIIQGNYIGTDISGNVALGNGQDGIISYASNVVIGGAAAGDRNIISANAGAGITLNIDNNAAAPTGNLIMGNSIGYGANGITALGNGGDGVQILAGASNNIIGGDGSGNLIGHNGRDGVYLLGGVGNMVSSNLITSNKGLGIDLNGDGVTPNDSGDTDTGSNNSQNYPTITSASTSGTVTVIQGTMNSTPLTKFHLEFFASSQPDPTGFGQGETFVGSTDVTTNVNGDANFNAGFSVVLNSKYVSATATDPAGNTSEFSLCAKLDSAPPAMSINDISISEGNSGMKSADLTVTLTHTYSVPVTVQYATADGTANASSDYVAKSGTLTFPAGETTQTISVQLTGDTQIEPNETFFVNLSNPANATFNKNKGTVTITNDDTQSAGALAFSAPAYTVNENGGPATFTVNRTGGSFGAVSVQYSIIVETAISGADYTDTKGTLNFADGETSKQFSVNIIDDNLQEPDETFKLFLSNPTNGATFGTPSTAVVTIHDDETSGPTTVRFNSTNVDVIEGLETQTVFVTRTGDTSAPATVDYATSDGTATQHGDYEITSGTLSFAAGETSKSFDVLINDDSYTDAGETINLTLSNPTGAVLGPPSTMTLTITEEGVEQTTNPNDDAGAFVYQQYHDFLNREPDADGLAYWTSQITNCGNDQACINQKRRDVSAAFYIENEFQQTGFFIYRLQKASLGAQPTYQQFMADRSRITSGPNMSQSKQSFAASFVQRQSFLQMYPAALSADDFVNKLYDTAGLQPYAQERQQQIQAMQNGKTRAEVLQDLIETPELKQREYNPSFVLMQYFGYLRRDPEQAGYDFWLGVLNNGQPNDYQGMVCSFITSAEYQQRFGATFTHSNGECVP